VLGAVAAFLSILITGLERVLDRHRELRAVGAQTADDASRVVSTSLRRRMKLSSRAILFAVISAFVTATLLVMSFLAALFGMGHTGAVAALFVIAPIAMMVSLGDLALEAPIQFSTMHLE
jgi:Protein of unknown function (DUF2721)